MTDVEKYIQVFNALEPDLRLEYIMSTLTDDVCGADDIIVSNAGTFKRAFHHDVEKITEAEFEYAREKKVLITVNRDSVYDNLPENLFHLPLRSQSSAAEPEEIEEIQAQRETEQLVRSYFLPYEQEFYRQRLLLEFTEQKYVFTTSGLVANDELDDFWNLPDCFDAKQKSRLSILFPVLHKVSHRLPLAAKIIELVTGDTVVVEEGLPLGFVLPESPELNNMWLGVDSVLGGTIKDVQSCLIVRILINKEGQLADHLSNDRKRKVYEVLCSLLFSLEKDIVIELDLSKINYRFTIDDAAGHTSVLHYTTLL